MEKNLRVGILRETKIPPDRRVPLTPPQITQLEENYPSVEFVVQPSGIRCYSNEEYEYLNIPLREDLSHCDILLGVKEVDKQTFIEGKTYMFFAHVAKKQAHNRAMFHAMIERKLTLIDYELLTDEHGRRAVAFGRHAGIVGAYNALRARGIRTNNFKLKPAFECRDLDEMWAGLRLIHLRPDLKIIVTGEGRVAGGILETLAVAGITKVSINDFLNRNFEIPVFCQLGPSEYLRHREGKDFVFSHFTQYPWEYESAFRPFYKAADILITGHYWDPRSPRFFNRDDILTDNFKISIIADITCDILGSIPTTIRASTITDPYYAYNPVNGSEEKAFTNPRNITVMAVDNLPGELPRDASGDFGKMLMSNVLCQLFVNKDSTMIRRATILKEGRLTEPYASLADY